MSDLECVRLSAAWVGSCSVPSAGERGSELPHSTERGAG